MRLYLKTVIINTKTGKAFRGVLSSTWFGLIVLKKAEMLRPGGETMPIVGEVVLYKADVDFIQVITP